MNCESIGFAIIVAACLFATGDHDGLFWSSLIGLWLSALSPNVLHNKHSKDDGEDG